MMLDFHVAADSGTPAATSGDISGRFPGNDMLSDLHCRYLKAWLGECVGNEKHPFCNKTISGQSELDPRWAPLPARCIVIDESKDPGREACLEARLEETSGKHGAYMTLSHRWFDDKDAEKSKTTSDNYKDRLARIPTSEMSKTFQDAIQIAYGLGLRFLWIDSICIIQSGDDGMDFDHESLNMADYYQNSMLTLFGTSISARDISDPGVVPQGMRRKYRHLEQLPYRDSHGARRGYFYLYDYHYLASSYGTNIPTSHLFSRGWVFQEWLLSRRKLFYTPDGVVFECKEGGPQNSLGEGWAIPRNPSGYIRDSVKKVTSEFPDLLEYTRLIYKEERISKWTQRNQEYSWWEQWTDDPLTPRVRPSLECDLKDGTFSGWYDIVSAFTQKKFKYLSDRLTALAGISLEYQRFMLMDSDGRQRHPRFLSGMWTRDIHTGLLWVLDEQPILHYDYKDANLLQKSEGLSSWSWAAFPANVSWQHLELYNKTNYRIAACEIYQAGKAALRGQMLESSMCQGKGKGKGKVARIESDSFESDMNWYNLPTRKDDLFTDSPIVAAQREPLPCKLNDKFTHLKMRGKFQAVLIRDRKCGDDSFPSLDRSGKATCFGPKSCQRYLCSPASANIISGLGSLEYLERENRVVQNVFALHIMTGKRSCRKGVTLGYWKPWCDFYYALLVHEVGSFTVAALVLFRPSFSSSLLALIISPFSTTNHLWDSFNFSVFSGVLPSQFGTSLANPTITLHWKARESGEGESTFDNVPGLEQDESENNAEDDEDEDDSRSTSTNKDDASDHTTSESDEDQHNPV
ncbi:MAG: hypothetical protein Q9227_009589, partial [Pyrenula ochraceoflavens]